MRFLGNVKCRLLFSRQQSYLPSQSAVYDVVTSTDILRVQFGPDTPQEHWYSQSLHHLPNPRLKSFLWVQQQLPLIPFNTPTTVSPSYYPVNKGSGLSRTTFILQKRNHRQTGLTDFSLLLTKLSAPCFLAGQSSHRLLSVTSHS